MLNILPTAIKRKAKLQKHYRIIQKMVYLVLIIILLPKILLIANYYYLNQSLQETKNSLPMEINIENDVDSTDNKITEFNNALSNAKLIQSEHLNPNILISDILTIIPDNILLNTLDISMEKKTITITGTAADRNALIELRKQLSESEYFSNFNDSISSLTEKENIKFDYSGEFDYED